MVPESLEMSTAMLCLVWSDAVLFPTTESSSSRWVVGATLHHGETRQCSDSDVDDRMSMVAKLSAVAAAILKSDWLVEDEVEIDDLWLILQQVERYNGLVGVKDWGGASVVLPRERLCWVLERQLNHVCMKWNVFLISELNDATIWLADSSERNRSCAMLSSCMWSASWDCVKRP